MARILTLDNLGRHVHGSARHGLVGLGAGEILDKRASLTGNDLGGTKVNVLDDAVVIKEDVYVSGQHLVRWYR
jgi:hypothetical protein